MARGLGKDLRDAEGERNPFHDIGNHPERRTAAASRHSHSQHNISRSRLHLPDVTGLTSAVESPARPNPRDRYGYADNGEAKEAEARLLQTLSVVQSKLARLEDENGISRRRVRELEYELEICKEDVVRERTRVLEAGDLGLRSRTNSKGKAKATNNLGRDRDGEEDITVRYKEVVEEKKGS
jgi:hypothetical protein